MQLLGPESSDERELREWFARQTRENLGQLEQGARTLTQLITGLYGLLFAVLALSNQPAYLQQPVVRWAGSVGVCLFFGALLAAMLVVLPRKQSYQRDNLSDMEQVYRRLQQRKANLLRTAQFCFVIGIGCLVAVILAILWGI